jgi:hypothetical protein
LAVTLKQTGRFSISTLQKLQAAVKQLQNTYITTAKARRFIIGATQLSLHEFTSLNAAGRSIGLNRFTGENRMRRANQLQSLLIAEAFGERRGYLYCAMDHSQFGPFCIAVLAVSFRNGRAVPIWVQVNKSEAALILPLLAALEVLLADTERHSPPGSNRSSSWIAGSLPTSC